jgi:hypothetical protein
MTERGGGEDWFELFAWFEFFTRSVQSLFPNGLTDPAMGNKFSWRCCSQDDDADDNARLRRVVADDEDEEGSLLARQSLYLLGTASSSQSSERNSSQQRLLLLSTGPSSPGSPNRAFPVLPSTPKLFPRKFSTSSSNPDGDYAAAASLSPRLQVVEPAVVPSTAVVITSPPPTLMLSSAGAGLPTTALPYFPSPGGHRAVAAGRLSINQESVLEIKDNDGNLLDILSVRPADLALSPTFHSHIHSLAHSPHHQLQVLGDADGDDQTEGSEEATTNGR